MGLIKCGCSQKSKSLIAAIFSLMVSVMVLFFSLKGIIFEPYATELKINVDIAVVSAFAIVFTVLLIVGVVRKSRHLFLPWLFAFAVAISIAFLYSLYLVVFHFQTDALIGSILFIATGFCYYGWASVAAFYSHLKDTEIEEDNARRFAQVNATSDTANILMRQPPPPYSITYENPLANEKPPPYEEVRTSEENRY